MAGSRDVLNAFIAHVDSLIEAGRLDAARAAWVDFYEHVVPSFPELHRDEARRRRVEFEQAHPLRDGLDD